ncbi:MAG TPA: ABC transporter substrate-binding protein, partial [Methylomirabilota bacterium]|nr:ABC transporter substrate-binding protein [Methylomirabilota bacterium]
LWIVESLARPGGNVTGQSCMSAELSPKRLQLLKEAAPRISRVAFLYNPDEPGPTLAWKLSLDAAPSLGITLLPVPIRRPEEFDGALGTISREQADGLFVYPDLVTISPRMQARTVEFANKQRLPAVYAFRWWVDAGGLVSYGTTSLDMVRRAVRQVDKILKGTKPADIPVEQPTRFELVINIKAAKALGLTIPPSVLIRADQLIE